MTILAFVVLIVAGSVWVALNPQWVLALGHWGYLGAFLIGLISSATIILPAPGIALLIAMGTALDPLLLGVVAAAGSASGRTHRLLRRSHRSRARSGRAASALRAHPLLHRQIWRRRHTRPGLHTVPFLRSRRHHRRHVAHAHPHLPGCGLHWQQPEILRPHLAGSRSALLCCCTSSIHRSLAHSSPKLLLIGPAWE